MANQAKHATFASFRFRAFRLFFVGQLISQVGSWLRQIGMALLVLHLTDDGVAVGIVTACQFLPLLVLGPWCGLVADRSDKRRLLLIVQLGLMLQSYVLAAMVFAGDPPITLLYIVALAGGVGGAFENPARSAFVVEMVSETHLQNAVSLNSAQIQVARVIGPALAGLLISTAGFAWCFLLDGVSYLVVTWFLWRIRADELRPPPRATRGRAQVREGLRYVAQVPALA